eukprot:10212879-Alexandrium_andersonii.AAC.1
MAPDGHGHGQTPEPCKTLYAQASETFSCSELSTCGREVRSGPGSARGARATEVGDDGLQLRQAEPID